MGIKNDNTPPIRERIKENEINMRETLPEKFRGWRLGLSLQWESILKAVVCVVVICFIALLQTTLFSRFRLFGSVPDLMLSMVIAVAISEREKWGSVVGIIAALVIESLGEYNLSILPLFYMLVGYIVGILSVNYFRDSAVVRIVYTASASFIRALITIVVLLATVGASVGFVAIVIKTALPEFIVSVLFSFVPHIITKLALKPFAEHRRDADDIQQVRMRLGLRDTSAK